MISAEKARMLFKTEDELKEKRINAVVEQVLSLIEIDITEAAKQYKSVLVRFSFGDMRNYQDTSGYGIDYHPTDKNIYIDSVDGKRIFYNGIKAEERFEVIVRVFDKLSKFGYTSDLDIDVLSYIVLPPEGELKFIKISWE